MFDDISIIQNNFYIKNLEFISFLWDENYSKYFSEKSYRPFVTATYFIDFWLWGLDPFGYHLDNLILHLINSGLVLLFLKRLFPEQAWVLFASTVFCIHPIMTETVNAIGFREELLTVCFALISLLLFLKLNFSAQKRIIHSYKISILSLVMFFTGLLSKESMLIFPLLVVLVFYQFSGQVIFSKNLNQKFYFAGLIAVWFGYIFLRFFLFQVPGLNEWDIFFGKASLSDQYLNLLMRVSSGFSIIGYYLKLWVFPFPLAADYTFPISSGWEWMRSILTVLILFGLTWQIFIRASSSVRFGWFWFLIALIPTINIYPIAHPIAERYLYFPWIGGCVVFSNVLWALKKYFKNAFYHNIQWILLFGILVSFCILTINRNSDWKNSDTLWLQNYRTLPSSWRALNGVGLFYLKQENYPAAITAFKRSIKLNSGGEEAISNLGLAYHKANENIRAEEILQRGLKLNSRNTKMLINLGQVKSELGKPLESFQLLNKAMDLEPYWAEPHLARGNLLLKMRDYNGAYRDFLKASEVRPDYPDPLNNLGVLLGKFNRLEEAIIRFKEALRIDPENNIALINMALTYYYLKDYENTRKYANIALGLGINIPETLLPLMKSLNDD